MIQIGTYKTHQEEEMATPPDSPIEEVVYELEPSREPKPVPVALEDLCRLTKFTRQEIRVMYRGFKTVSYYFFFFYFPHIICFISFKNTPPFHLNPSMTT